MNLIIFSSVETEQCFDDIMSDKKNYERVQELVEDGLLHTRLSEEEQIGYVTAYLESFIRSDFFKTDLTKAMIEEVACEEIVRDLFWEEYGYDI